MSGSRTLRSLILVWAGALVPWLLGGCLAEGKCYVHDDCGAGQVCLLGECITPGCTADDQCADGQQCLRYACQAAGQPAPDFALEDVNPRSATFGQSIGAATFKGDVLLMYFAAAT